MNFRDRLGVVIQRFGDELGAQMRTANAHVHDIRNRFVGVTAPSTRAHRVSALEELLSSRFYLVY